MSETVRIIIAIIAAFAGGEVAGIAVMLWCPPEPLRRVAGRAGREYRARPVTAPPPSRVAVDARGRLELEQRRRP